MTNVQKYLAQYGNLKDSGRKGKAFELATREYLSGRTQKSIKSQGKFDAYFTYTVDGKTKVSTIEIKTACGEIDTATRSKIVIYCPDVQETEEAEVQGFVFTRKEWIDFVNGYKGRGQFTKVDSQRGTKHIQSFYTETRPKASKPIASYIWNACMDKPTTKEWREAWRG